MFQYFEIFRDIYDSGNKNQCGFCLDIIINTRQNTQNIEKILKILKERHTKATRKILMQNFIKMTMLSLRVFHTNTNDNDIVFVERNTSLKGLT